MTTRPRIAFYTETYLVGGAERCLFDLINHIDHDRFDVSLWCNDNPTLIQAARQRIIPPTEIGVARLPGLATRRLAFAAQNQSLDRPVPTEGLRGWVKALLRYGYIAVATRSLGRVFARVQPDIVHINNGGYPGAQSCRAALLAAAHAKVPSRVMMIHNLAFPYSPIRSVEAWLDRRVERAATHLVTASSTSRDALVRERGFKPESISNVHLGVEESIVNPLAASRCRAEIGLDGATPLIGLVASFELRKGHQYLLPALAQVARQIPLARLVLLGSGGGNEDNIRRLTDELGLTGRVFFLGYRRDVMDWMTACDVIVLPSTDLEGYGYVLLEAMSIGKPTIGTQVGGIPETIEDGVTGLVVPPADVAALAGALKRILTDRELAERMGRAGQARVRRLFGMEKMVSSLVTLYESDLNHGKG